VAGCINIVLVMSFQCGIALLGRALWWRWGILERLTEIEDTSHFVYAI
jgi:hypothetical protein